MNVPIYEWLSREFKPIDVKLDAEGKTELDGIVWKIAQELGSFQELDFERPTCPECGVRMVRSGETFRCPECLAVSGVS